MRRFGLTGDSSPLRMTDLPSVDEILEGLSRPVGRGRRRGFRWGAARLTRRLFGGIGMSRKPHVAVEPRANGRWAVQTNGTKRADSLHDRKTDAIARARELAGNKQTELVIKSTTGHIVGKDSHGKDPRSIKG